MFGEQFGESKSVVRALTKPIGCPWKTKTNTN